VNRNRAWTTLCLSHPFLLPPDLAMPVVWENALHTVPGSWPASEPTKITVPPGYGSIELKAGICFEPECSGLRQIYSRRNGSNAGTDGRLFADHPGGWATGSSVSFTTESATIPVIPGDYFELLVFHNADRALWIGGVPRPGRAQSAEAAYGCVYFEAKFYAAP
jgi:hypothetical protein